METQVVFEGKWGIEQVRRYLFERAKLHYKRSRYAGWFAVIFVVIPVSFQFTPSDWTSLIDTNTFKFLFKIFDRSNLTFILGGLSTVAIMAHWWYFSAYKRYQVKAKEVSNLELMYNISNRRKIKEIVQRYLPEIINLKETYTFNGNKYYSVPKEINIYQEVGYKILENCIWNAYLYEQIYKKDRNRLIYIAVLVIGLFIMVLVMSGKVLPIDTAAMLGYVIGLIGTSSLAFNYLDNLFLSRDMSASYDELGKEIHSQKVDTREKLGYIHNKYSYINLKAPNINEKLYQEHQDKLNRTWEFIQQGLPKTNARLVLKEILPVVKQLFENNQIKWAITGSTSLLIKNQLEYCRDIDIILKNAHDAPRVNQILSPFLVEEMCFWISPDIRSYYGKFNIGGVNIEVISEVENLTHLGWIPHPTWDICWVKFYNNYYPVTSKKFEKQVKHIMLLKPTETHKK